MFINRKSLSTLISYLRNIEKLVKPKTNKENPPTQLDLGKVNLILLILVVVDILNSLVTLFNLF